jgi:hypothetical protein
MLKLLSFELSIEEMVTEQKWTLPIAVPPSSISSSIGALRSFLADPPDLEVDPKSVLRRQRKQRRTHDQGDEDEEENREPRRRKKRAADIQVYKSAAFIIDSDNDEETDRLFFERERQLRNEMDELARIQGGAGGMRVNGKKKRKRKEGGQEGGGKKMSVGWASLAGTSYAGSDADVEGDGIENLDGDVELETDVDVDSDSDLDGEQDVDLELDADKDIGSPDQFIGLPTPDMHSKPSSPGLLSGPEGDIDGEDQVLGSGWPARARAYSDARSDSEPYLSRGSGTGGTRRILDEDEDE